MSSKPLVSGIIIFLNAEKFIEEAIESVFAQTYDHWELLLVDDGSTDGSTAIALQYAEQYPEKVRYLEHDGHQNRGMSASRNKGIRDAKGEYIAFLDADDVWLAPKLEQQVAILGSQPEIAMVFGPSQWWYSWTGKPEDIQRDSMREIGVQLNTLFKWTGKPEDIQQDSRQKIAVQPNTLFKPPTLFTLFLRNEARTPATCSVLVRRQVFKDIGGFESTFRGMYEDQAFFAKVYLKAPVFLTSECWDRYRQHSDNCCSVARNTGQYNTVNPHPAHLAFLNWLAKYLSQEGVKDIEIWQVFQEALQPYRHPMYFLYQMKLLLKRIARRTLPVPARRWLRASIARS